VSAEHAPFHGFILHLLETSTLLNDKERGELADTLMAAVDDFRPETPQDAPNYHLALLRVTGSLGLIIGGAGANAPGHLENYEYAKRILAGDSAHPDTGKEDGEIIARLESKWVRLNDDPAVWGFDGHPGVNLADFRQAILGGMAAQSAPNEGRDAK
jgi:hypothetical protein